jgi:phosphatidylserine decarboxylase
VGAFVHPAVVAAGIAGFLFTLYFFRDPERKIMAEPGQIVAPADGKVLSIDEVQEKDFMGERCKRISIFLSILDVHINRAPVAGKIEIVRHTPGKFAFANTIDASLNNESNVIGIAGENVKVVVKQIAGAVARRIVCYCKPAQLVHSGDRIGMIKFGSRTELYLPVDCEVLVKVGQKVKGGVSLVGAYNEAFEKKT